MPSRIPIFDTPHKALRNAMGQFSFQLGKTDFSNQGQVDKMVELGNTVFSMLNIHAEGENAIYSTDLTRFDAAQAKRMESEHHRIETNQNKVQQAMLEIQTRLHAGENVLEEGYALVGKWNAFHTDYFIHILDEEQNIQPIIWKNMTDQEIMDQSKRAMTKVDPKAMAAWTPFILPALNRFERVNMFRGMKAGMPAPAFEGMMNAASGILSSSEFQELEKDLS